MSPKRSHFSLLTLLLVLFAHPAGSLPGQAFPWVASAEAFALPVAGEAANGQKPVSEPDPFGRENPRDSFSSFVKALTASDYQRAAQYLLPEDRKKPEQLEPILVQFRSLLDRGYGGIINSISNQPAGELGDGLKSDEESAGQIKIKENSLTIILTRIEPKDGAAALWLISTETLKGIPALYAAIEPVTWTAKIPAVLVQKEIWGAPLYVWIGALVFIPIAFGVAWLLVHAAALLVRLGKKLFGRRLEPHPFAVARPAIILLATILHYIVVSRLGLPILMRHYYSRVVATMIWLGIGWLVLFLIDAAMRRYLARLKYRQQFQAQSLMLLAKKFLKVVVLCLLTLLIFRSLGIQIAPALAGLGIGGIALALAAQKTVENLFGGLSLLSDRSIVVGDLCKIGNCLGTVEDIGLRSTRIRTFDRTALFVPNGALSVEKLENFTRRDKFWFHHFLGLRYETTAEQIQRILTDIQVFFDGHEKIEKPSRATFVRLGDYSLDVELFAYIRVYTYEDYLKVAEGLLMKCMQIVASAGTGFAFPSQTNYLAQDSWPDAGPTKKT